MESKAAHKMLTSSKARSKALKPNLVTAKMGSMLLSKGKLMKSLNLLLIVINKSTITKV